LTLSITQRQVWGAATAEQYVEQWKEKAEEWDKKIKMSEEHLKKLEIVKAQYIDGKLIMTAITQ
jgi:hypothetical protein